MGFDEGPAVLSRFPIVAWNVVPVNSCDHWYGRVLLCATLDTPWGPLDACSTHTGSSTCQLRSLTRLLQGRRGQEIGRASCRERGESAVGDGKEKENTE